MHDLLICEPPFSLRQNGQTLLFESSNHLWMMSWINYGRQRRKMCPETELTLIFFFIELASKKI